MTMTNKGCKCPKCNEQESYGLDTWEKGVDYYLHPTRKGNRMVLRDGKYGEFWGCEGFPICKYSYPTQEVVEARRRSKTLAAVFSCSSPYDLM